MRLLTLVPVVAVSFAALSGCKKDEPEPTYPTTPQPTATVTQTAPPASTVATPVAASMAGPFLTGAITVAGTNDTKGMQPEGGTFAGQFQQGQILEQNFQGEPGKCYTIVAMGGPGVSELDAQIVIQPAPMLPPTVLSQDNMTGPQATIGGGGNCVKNPSPVGVPAKVVLRVVTGSGIAGAQIFKK
ncbi:MAG: hypothetical protein HOW73_04305 [Polyangiaceae bacterium]|nr:hypothetical protein [Polyangiaceae bacterium]